MSGDDVTLDDLFRRQSEAAREQQEARVQAAFGPAAPQQAGDWSASSLGTRARSYQQWQAIHRQVTSMPPLRQRRPVPEEAPPKPIDVKASPSPPRPAFLIDWYNATHWSTPEGSYPIRDMVDQHLWNTLIWCVRNCEELHRAYDQVLDIITPGLAARRWLRLQPAFRAMLQEALRRQLSFPRDVHEYLRHYLLGQGDELENATPWRDPIALAAQRELQAFMQEPVIVAEDYGKQQRAIDLRSPAD